MFKNKQKILEKVVTICSFSSAKPANIWAMFDTILKIFCVKCYSFKQSQVFPFQLRQLHQGRCQSADESCSSEPLGPGEPMCRLADYFPDLVTSGSSGRLRPYPGDLNRLVSVNICNYVISADVIVIPKQSLDVPTYIFWELKLAACRVSWFAVISRSCSTMCRQPPGKAAFWPESFW